MELAKRIRLIRVIRGYSQDYVASQMDISQSAYSKIERKAGSSSYYTLEKIANVLGVSVPFLVDIGNNNYDEHNP
jgi:transcriptional regulator with XRE-family HTH domain